MDTEAWWGTRLLDAWPDDVAWALAERTVTYGELRERVAQLARMFAINGIGPGSTVVLRMPPSLTLLWSLFALWSRGAQVMLIDTRLPRAEVEQLLEFCRPQHRISSGGPNAEAAPFHPECEVTIERRRVGLPAQTEHCLVQLTSGTAGRPRVIGRTPASLLAEVERFARLDAMPGRGERIMLLSSMVHSFGLVGGVLHALNSGAVLVFSKVLQPDRMLRTLQRCGPDAVFGMPWHVSLLNHAVPESAPVSLPRLRLVVSSGDALPAHQYEAFGRRFGLRVGQAYGTSEVGIVAADLLGVQPPPAVGVPVPGADIALRDGELWVRTGRSPYLRPGPDQQLADGWLNTHDRFDQDPATGVLRLRGRHDSVVTVDGIAIELGRIESALRAHELVTDAVVVPGPTIEAYVKAAAPVTETALATWCREQVGPDGVAGRFHIVPDIPRTTNGKLIRNRELLYATYAATAGSPNHEG
jgi:acyl-coenzyme A synthetase/AMP-(fatty) acid ligase